MVNVYLYGKNMKTKREWDKRQSNLLLGTLNNFDLNTKKECIEAINIWKDNPDIEFHILCMNPLFYKFLLVEELEFVEENIIFWLEDELMDGNPKELLNNLLTILSTDYYDLYIKDLTN